MRRTLWKSSFRYLTRHPWLTGLSVLGVALGVAVVVAIDLANTSARRAFVQSAASVTGRATHQVRKTTPGGVPDSLYRWLRVERGMRPSAPVVQGYAQAPAFPGRTFQVLGVDPLAEGPFRPYLVGGGDFQLSAFLTQPRAALIAGPTARTLDKTPGDTLTLRVEGRRRVAKIAGTIAPQNERSRRALRNLLIVDIAAAQDLFEQPGRLSRIDLMMPEGKEGERRLRRLRKALPAGVEVIRSESRTETVAQMTDAFSLNLQALSLLALVVGLFLIYNTVTFSVVQRRTLLGRLRALGVRRREVFMLVLGEALLVGVLGTGLGIGLGIVLAESLVRLVTQTINDLYFVVSVRSLTLAPATLLKGMGLGIGVAVGAAVFPAREATTAPAGMVLQRSREETRLQAKLPQLAGVGLGLGGLSVGMLALPSRSLTLSYGGLMGLLLGFALVTPILVVGFARLARPVLNWSVGVLGRMAARGVAQTLSRTAVAIAALTIAIAATVGVGVMVDSFRATVEAWLSYSLRADVYVQAPSPVMRRASVPLDSSVVKQLRKTPGSAGAYSVRNVRASSSVGRIQLTAIDPSPHTPETFRFKKGNPDEIWSRFEEVNMLIVSEPFAYRHDLEMGDTLRLHTDRGTRAFPVRGIFYDYSSDQGVVMMSRATYDRFYDDRHISGLALNAASGVPVDTLTRRLRQQAGQEQQLLIRSNRALRETSLEVFDRTFTVTAVLRLLAVIVAFVGVLSALMALQLERAHEVAVLRTTGMTPKQVGSYVTMQTSLMGLVAGVLSVPLGLTLAYVLIYVINKRSFGWTLQFDVDPVILGQAVLLGVVAAVLAGGYPAYQMATADPARALRETEGG